MKIDLVWTFLRGSGHSLERQRHTIEAYLLRHYGIELEETIELHVLDPLSGVRYRQAMSGLIVAAKSGAMRNLVVSCPTRLFRDLGRAMRFLRELEECGVAVHVASYRFIDDILVPDMHPDGMKR